MMRKALACLFLLAAGAAEAQDQKFPPVSFFHDGNTMHRICNEPNRQSAYGFVTGVMDGLSVAVGKGLMQRQYCEPNATIGQVTDIFCKYLADNPAKRHVNAADLVISSMVEAFPCQ